MTYTIEVTEEAKRDLSYFKAFALDASQNMGIARVHLDTFFWDRGTLRSIYYICTS